MADADAEDDLFRWLSTADKTSDAEFKVMFVRRSLSDAMHSCILAEEAYDEFIAAAGWKPETRAALHAQGKTIGRVVHQGNRFYVELTKPQLVQRALNWIASQTEPVVDAVYTRVDERLRDWSK